jgi:acetyl-CoA synthetase
MGLPLPGWEVALLDEDEQAVPQGQTGEICLRPLQPPLPLPDV